MRQPNATAGFAHRAGFQRMVAEVSLGHVGIILCFEASRLSRNSKDWAQLFELFGHLDTLLADLDQVYDLALPDDRLILGVKGSVSEYELSLFRQRSQEAIRVKAKRGELQFMLPAGLCWTSEGTIERHPDRRVQHAIRMVLDTLSEFGGGRAHDRCQAGAPKERVDMRAGPPPRCGPRASLGRRHDSGGPAVCPRKLFCLGDFRPAPAWQGDCMIDRA